VFGDYSILQRIAYWSMDVDDKDKHRITV
jgi:hypothetical protein